MATTHRRQITPPPPPPTTTTTTTTTTTILPSKSSPPKPKTLRPGSPISTIFTHLKPSSTSSCSLSQTPLTLKPHNHVPFILFSLLFSLSLVQMGAPTAAPTTALTAAPTTATTTAPTASNPYSLPSFVVPLHRAKNPVEKTPFHPFSGSHGNGTRLSAESNLVTENQKRKVTEGEVNFVQAIGGSPGEGFYVAMDFGTPKQRLNVLVDTGSSNFAVAGDASQNVAVYFDESASSTLKKLWRRISLKYTQGEWVGELVSDVVSLADTSPTASARAPFALITSSKNFFLKWADWQGILGLAFKRLAQPKQDLPTFVDLVVADHKLDDVFTLELCGSEIFLEGGGAKSSGHLSIGGVNPKAFEGEIFYSPLQKAMYYEVVIADIDVNGESLQVPCGAYNSDKTIVDSGTTNMQLPDSVFRKLISSLQRSTSHSGIPLEFWSREKLLCNRDGIIDFSLFPTIGISLFSDEYNAFRIHFRPQQYLRAVSTYGIDGTCYKFSITSSGGLGSGSIIGGVVMEGFYVVFDRERMRIGFAGNACKEKGKIATIHSSLTPPSRAASNLSSCAFAAAYEFDGDFDRNERLMIASYALGGVAVFLLGVMLVLLVGPSVFGKKGKGRDQSEYEQFR